MGGSYFCAAIYVPMNESKPLFHAAEGTQDIQ